MTIFKTAFLANDSETNTGSGLIQDINVWLDEARGVYVAKLPQTTKYQENFWIGFGLSKETAILSFLNTQLELENTTYQFIKDFAAKQDNQGMNEWAERIYITRENLNLSLAAIGVVITEQVQKEVEEK